MFLKKHTHKWPLKIFFDDAEFLMDLFYPLAVDIYILAMFHVIHLLHYVLIVLLIVSKKSSPITVLKKQ